MDRLSAWMDGELDESHVGAELARVKEDPELRERWDTFHLIGDAMRGDHVLSADFQDRLNRKLAAEPTILAPVRHKMRSVVRYALSAAASVSAIAIVAWIALSNTGPLNYPQLAQVSPPAPALQPAVPVANVPDNGKMHEYLLAHMGVSPSTALQGVAPYVLTVSTQPAEGR